MARHIYKKNRYIRWVFLPPNKPKICLSSMRLRQQRLYQNDCKVGRIKPEDIVRVSKSTRVQFVAGNSTQRLSVWPENVLTVTQWDLLAKSTSRHSNTPINLASLISFLYDIPCRPDSKLIWKWCSPILVFYVFTWYNDLR